MKKLVALFMVISMCALLSAPAFAAGVSDFSDMRVNIEYEYHDKLPGEEYPNFVSEDTSIPSALRAEMKDADPSTAVSYSMETKKTVLHDAIEAGRSSQGTVGSDDSFEIVALNSGDTRTEITNVNSYKKVVYVKAYFNVSSTQYATAQGTGAMISNEGVLTAGHVIYSQEYGWPYKVEITPGGLNSSAETITLSSGSVVSVKGWTEDGNYEYDYGVLQLDTPLNIGYYGTKYYGSSSSLKGQTVNRYGFPSDQDGDNIWKATGNVDIIRDKQFSYTDGYGAGGESGGPVIMSSNGRIVGVHSGTSTVSGETYGMAVRIRSEIVDFIVEYGGATRE